MQFTGRNHISFKRNGLPKLYNTYEEAKSSLPEHVFIVPVLSKDEWEHLKPEYKTYKDGSHNVIFFGPKGSTIYSPCIIL